jgi:predicted nucleic acid-binding protein
VEAPNQPLITGWAQADEPTPSSLPALIRSLVDREHASNAAAEIVVANEYGVFPTLKRAPAPVAADANVLNRDIAQACRQERHTVLVNIANAGMIRLFAAEHVLDEVDRHAERIARKHRVPLDRFMELWQVKYLPLIRLVQVEPGLLSPVEQHRIDMLDHGPLELCDHDDVPSASLALQLGAFFLTTDRKALKAVYGPNLDLSRHDDWLSTLQLSGQSSATDEVARTLVIGPEVAAFAAWHLLKWLWQEVSPVAALGLIGVGGYAAWRAEPETRGKALRSVGNFVNAMADLQQQHHAAETAFGAAAPPIPSWEQLAETNNTHSVLTRALLYTLARSPASDRSAVELSEQLALLPRFPVPHGDATVRAALRSRRCFEQVYRGRWQAGLPPI